MRDIGRRRLAAALAVCMVGASDCEQTRQKDDSHSAPAIAAESTVCSIESDQKASLLPAIPAIPVRLTVDEDFDQDQIGWIRTAADLWNDFSRSFKGQNLFKVEVGRVSDTKNPRDCDELDGSAFDYGFPVVREDSKTRWTDFGLSEVTPAVTFRCATKYELTSQVIYLNTAYLRPEQFLSVAIHELGHAIGLDHSCLAGTGKNGFGSCDGLADDHAYHLASMYPSLRAAMPDTGEPERKEKLGGNDESRAKCLYE